MEIITKGKSVKAEQWHTWRDEGKSNKDIALILGISSSMACIIARKFRAAGYPDPQYRKTRPGRLVRVDTETDEGAYILGILWGAGSKVDRDYLIRHRDPFYLSIVSEHLGLANELQKSYSRTGDQYRLKISRSNFVKSLDVLLTAHSWEKRNHFLRPFPKGNVDSRGFTRAWVELHAAADIHHTGRNSKPKPRLRIYGNVELIEKMNKTISVNTGLAPRTVQKTTNETTKALYYCGSSFVALVDWLYEGAAVYNSAARKKFQDILSGS